jgi:hypothetical protein
MVSTRQVTLQPPAAERQSNDLLIGHQVLRPTQGEVVFFRCGALVGKQQVKFWGRKSRPLLVFCGCRYHRFEVRNDVSPCGHAVTDGNPLRISQGRISEPTTAEIARWRVQVREKLALGTDVALRRCVREFDKHPQFEPQYAASAAYTLLCFAEGIDAAQEWVRTAAAGILDGRKAQVAA